MDRTGKRLKIGIDNVQIQRAAAENLCDLDMDRTDCVVNDGICLFVVMVENGTISPTCVIAAENMLDAIEQHSLGHRGVLWLADGKRQEHQVGIHALGDTGETILRLTKIPKQAVVGNLHKLSQMCG